MRLKIDRRTVVLALLLFVIVGCAKRETPSAPDYPRLTTAVAMRDVIFHSGSLERDMPYRVILPKEIPINKRLPVVYLLHGGGGGFHDWSNYSEVARFAEQGLILVMPEGNSSYYTNSSDRPQDRYEDYIIKDLVADVERQFPADSSGHSRAIVGISMGGYGAIKIALKHPEMFTFAGELVQRSTCQPGRFRLNASGSGGSIERSLDRGEVGFSEKMIHTCWRKQPTRALRLSFF